MGCGHRRRPSDTVAPDLVRGSRLPRRPPTPVLCALPKPVSGVPCGDPKVGVVPSDAPSRLPTEDVTPTTTTGRDQERSRWRDGVSDTIKGGPFSYTDVSVKNISM